MFNFLFLLVGLGIGVGLAWFLFKGKLGFGKSSTSVVQSNSVVESIERVFKVVTAEGQISEIYDYQNTEKLLSFIPSTKKVLLIVNAKVLMGFDFKKFKFEYDEETRKINILEFPQPEILSIEPDMKYYNMENGLFNKFNNEDLTKIQKDAKAKISEAALKSELPKIAQKQMQTLLLELSTMKHLSIEGQEKLGGNGLLIEQAK
ncbi:MAG: DUF4230 domain-containing protein [Chitinophagaceae bacterium]